MKIIQSSKSGDIQSNKQPINIRFIRWHHQNKQTLIEFFSLLLGILITYIVLSRIDFFELFYGFTRKYEHLDLDEILFVLIIDLAIFMPIFALRRLQESRKHLEESQMDRLTGIFNYRKGLKILELEIKLAQHYQRHLSIISFDIDDFKLVNDKHGHIMGDQTLSQIAEVVQTQIRNTDSLIRWGGEEFLIICPETNLKDARRLAERIRKIIQQSYLQNPLQITVSLGVAQLRVKDSLESLYKRVDKKLYQAKSAGKNRVC